MNGNEVNFTIYDPARIQQVQAGFIAIFRHVNDMALYYMNETREVKKVLGDGGVLFIPEPTVIGIEDLTGQDISILRKTNRGIILCVSLVCAEIMGTALAESSGGGGGGSFPGPQGPQGPQGPSGGSQGAQGAPGSQGDTGSQGLTGPQGNTGTQGNIGSQGLNGTQGLTGTQGLSGPQGGTGPQGDTGAQGATGTQGSQGPQGDGINIYNSDGTLTGNRTLDMDGKILLFTDGPHKSADFLLRSLYMNDGLPGDNLVLNWQAQQLYRYPSLGGTLSLDWSQSWLTDVNEVVSLAWDDRILYSVEPAQTPSLAWQTRELIDSVAFTTLNWELRNLIGTNGTSVDWENGILTDTNLGGLTSIDWTNRKARWSGGDITMDWEFGQLTLPIAGNIPTVDWFALQLNSTDGANAFLSVDWQNRDLWDGQAVPILSVDWDMRQLFSSIGTLSLDWEAKTMAGNWSPDSLTVGDGATGTFTTVDLKTVTVTSGIVTSIV